MAKDENKVETSEIKRKAKKRKQQQSDDAFHEEKVYLEQSLKGTKRKSQPLTTTSKKRKPHKDTSEPAPSDDEIQEPSLQLLLESEKPENVPDIETVRLKKQKSHEKNLKGKQEQSSLKEAERNEDYLKRWRNDRKEWKFEKLRQVSIQKSILDKTKLSDKIFPIALEYLSGTKGAARSAMEKSAEDEVKRLSVEFKNSPELKKNDVQATRYKRAIELAQILT